MKLSVLVPTLNRKDYLKVTLEKLLPQIKRNSNNVELVLSINASNDDTFTFINQLNTENNNLIKIKNFSKRVGICESFSRSIELCKGEFIIIFGDDDIPAPFLVETILNEIELNANVGLFHFNRLVASDINFTQMQKMRVEQFDFSSTHLNYELSDFIEKYTISPGFISAMVFKRESWSRGDFIDNKKHYGYDFLSRIYAGISKLQDLDCMYISYPLVLQRMVKNREWNDTWPKYWLIGVPNLLSTLDKENISVDAIKTWDNELNKSWKKFVYILLWASSYRNKFKPLIKEIKSYQKGFLRKILVSLIINFCPKFVFSQIRKYLYN